MADDAPPAHGGQRRWAAEAYGGDATRWLDFSANLNPLGPPQCVMEALRHGLGEIAFYPDLEAKEATRALAGYLGVAPGQLLLTSGGMEAIYLAVRALQPRSAIIREPAFGGYREALGASGVPALSFFGPARDLLTARIEPGTLIVLGQPGNPAGGLEDRTLLLALLGRLQGIGGHLLVDEAFIDFVERPEEHSLRKSANEPGLIVVGSLTKFYTLPGLRVGYALAAAELLQALRRQMTPWSVSSLAQIATVAAVSDASFVAESRRFLPPARREFATALQGTGAFAVTEGRANYLLLDATPSGIPAARWTRGAARRGILVRDASTFPGLTPYHLRVAVRTPAENGQVVQALAEIVRAR